MSAFIELPCGCKITDTCVIAMCIGHAIELETKERERQAAYREFKERVFVPKSGTRHG